MTAEAEALEQEPLKEPVDPPKKEKKKRKAPKKRQAAVRRKPKDKPVEYEGEMYRGVEFDDEGRLRLKEKYYTALTLAEQQAKLCEKDLELARLKESGYRREIETRLPPEVQRELANLAGKVQEANEKLAIARKQYRDEAQEVMAETGLELKKWLIDDMRRMRHVDKLK
jgi:hypothetical protein